MRLVIDLIKALGVKIAEEILLMNDYMRIEIEAYRAIMKKYGLTSRELDDEIKRRLSERARKLTPLSRVAVVKIASPKTVVSKWWHKAKAKMNDSSDKQPEIKKVGRPVVDEEIRKLVIEFAQDNPSAGVKSIANELKNLGHEVSRETVRKILKKAGIKPSPDRINGMTWFEFMKTSGIWQMDCTTTHIAVYNKAQKRTEIICYHILLFIHVATRKVVFGGIRENPDSQWVNTVVRSRLGYEFEEMKRVVMDRDPIFQSARHLFEQANIKTILLPSKSPNLNAYIERFNRTLKEGCLSWVFPTSEKQLRFVVNEYINYYNHWRPHQSLNGLPPDPDERIIKARNGELTGKIITEERLNGLIKIRYREAA
jgi:putative transposase